MEAIGDQVLHAKLAHVAQGHRRAVRLLGVHSITLSARRMTDSGIDSPKGALG